VLFEAISSADPDFLTAFQPALHSCESFRYFPLSPILEPDSLRAFYEFPGSQVLKWPVFVSGDHNLRQGSLANWAFGVVEEKTET